MITVELKQSLDKRICDVETQCENELTYRQWMLYCYGELYSKDKKELNKFNLMLDKMTETELQELLEDLDYLIAK